MFNVKGKFDEGQNGGYNHPDNPQIFIEVKKECQPAIIYEVQRDETKGDLYTGALLYKYPGDMQKRTLCYQEDRIERSNYSNSPKILWKPKLSVGKYVIICCTEHPGHVGTFTFGMNAKDDSAIAKCELLPLFQRKVLRGTWKEMFGALQGQKSLENPQFRLNVKKKAFCRIVLRDNVKDNSIYFTVVKGEATKKRKKYMVPKDVVHESNCYRAERTFLDFVLEPSKIDYYVIPASRKLQCDFTLTLDTIERNVVTVFQEIVERKKIIQEEDCRLLVVRHLDKIHAPFCKTNPLKDIERECKLTSSMFVDYMFPPNDTSLNADGGKKNRKIDEVKDWKRAADIFEDPQLYVDGVDVKDIRQGVLGDCWLLQGISVLGIEPTRITDMVWPKCKEGKPDGRVLSPCGAYVVRFYLYGQVRYIVVDDYFPVDEDNKLAFGRSLDPGEMYVPIIEKAWAKAMGSYRNLIGNTCNLSFERMSGGDATIDFHARMSTEELWKKCLQYSNNNWLMSSSPANGEETAKLNLVKGHAYSVLKCMEVEGLKLVKLRNPWAHKEWNGDYSDNSEKWTESLKKKVGWENIDDGIFYMTIDDFATHFRTTNFCKILPDIYPYQKIYDGDWIRQYGQIDKNEGLNPKIPLKVIHPKTNLYIALLRSTRMKEREEKPLYILVRLMKGDIRAERLPREQLVATSKYMAAEKVTIEICLDEGMYLLMPAEERPTKDTFRIIVMGDKDLDFGPHLKFKDPHPHRFVFRGDWKPNGGYFFVLNPRFNLYLEEDETEVVITLKREDKLKKLGILIVIVNSGVKLDELDRHPQIQDDEFIAESKYVRTNIIELTHTIKKKNLEKKPYCVVICAAEKLEGLKYHLTLRANKKCSFRRLAQQDKKGK